MTDSSIKPIRTYPSLPEPGNDLASHSNMLRQVKEGIQVHERRTSNWRDSFVRLGELVDLEILKVEGDLITLGDAVGSGLEPGPDGYILATIDGEIVWVPFDGLPIPSFDYTGFSPDELIEDEETVITITGTGFTEFSTATFDGEEVPVNFISETEIQITVTGSDQGTFVIEVTNPAPGGGSDSDSIDVVGNPLPVLISLSPDESNEDEATFIVTITGTGFIPTSQARWEGSNRDTTYNSPTELEVEILDSDITALGTFQIDVVNPAPGGGTSNTLDFDVVDASWTPADITTQVWLDAADAATITITTGVSQWDDKSGNGRHVVQGTGANQPAYGSTQLNGLDVVTFDGSNNALRSPSSVSGLIQNVGAATAYIVRNQTANPASDSTSDFVMAVGDGDNNNRRTAIFITPPNLESPPRLRAGGARADADSFAQVANPIGVASINAWPILAFPIDYTNDDAWFYIDGTLAATNTSFSSAGSTSNTAAGSLNIGCDITATPQLFLGHIAEVIITHSISQYERRLIEGYLAHKWGLEANLPPSHPYFAAPPMFGDDADIADVVLLLHCEGANAGTVLVDASPSAHNITVGSGVTTDTAQQKFGLASMRNTIVGSGGISIAGSADKDLLAQDFTVEMFIRFNSVTPQQTFINQYSLSDGNRAWWFCLATGPNLQFAYSTTGLTANDVLCTRSWSPSTNTWYHVAACRSGADLRLFVDGVQLGATFNIGADSIANSTENIGVGAFFPTTGSATQQCDAWLDEVRLTIGTARYTANFTPPAAAFPDL